MPIASDAGVKLPTQARRPWWRTTYLLIVLFAALYYAIDGLFQLTDSKDSRQDWLAGLQVVAGLLFAGSATYYLSNRQPI